jgi:hypothetical protein
MRQASSSTRSMTEQLSPPSFTHQPPDTWSGGFGVPGGAARCLREASGPIGGGRPPVWLEAPQWPLWGLYVDMSTFKDKRVYFGAFLPLVSHGLASVL